MRSVALLSLAKSYSAIAQWRWISSHAFCGMMLRRAWARASAASMSRYFWMRFWSAKMRRIDSVENMSRKIPELTPTAVILQPFGGQQHNQAPSLQNGRAAVHLRLFGGVVGWAKSPAAAGDLARWPRATLPTRSSCEAGRGGQRRMTVRANNPARHDAPLPTLQIG